MKQILLITVMLIASILTFGQTNKDKSKAAYFAAEEAYNTGDYKKCIIKLAESEELLGAKIPPILEMRVKAYFKDENFVNAYKTKKEFFEIANSNYEGYDNILRISIDIDEAPYKKGIAAYKAKNYTKAINHLTQAKEIAPDSKNFTEMLWKSYYLLGIQNIDTKDYNSAINNFNKSLDINPNNKLVFHVIAYTYLLKKDKVKSIEYYKKVEGMHLNFNGYTRMLTEGDIGDAYFVFGDYKNAVKYPISSFTKAISYYRLGKLESAKNNLLLVKDPNTEVYNILAVICYRLGDYSNAILYANKALNKNNDGHYGFHISHNAYQGKELSIRFKTEYYKKVFKDLDFYKFTTYWYKDILKLLIAQSHRTTSNYKEGVKLIEKFFEYTSSDFNDIENLKLLLFSSELNDLRQNEYFKRYVALKVYGLTLITGTRKVKSFYFGTESASSASLISFLNFRLDKIEIKNNSKYYPRKVIYYNSKKFCSADGFFKKNGLFIRASSGGLDLTIYGMLEYTKWQSARLCTYKEMKLGLTNAILYKSRIYYQHKGKIRIVKNGSYNSDPIEFNHVRLAYDKEYVDNNLFTGLRK